MRSQTVSTGCDEPEGKGRARASCGQDALGAGAGYGGIRRGAHWRFVRGDGARSACQSNGGRAVRGACAHVGVPSSATRCLGVGGGHIRVLICKVFHEDAGQATIEAAFALPVALALVVLLVQPGILLYDRIVMQQAAAETCRLLATTPEGDPSGTCKAFALRRLGAVPEQDCFHVHQGGCTWEVELEGGEASDAVRVRITTKAKPLPLIGVGARLLGIVNDGDAFEVSVEASAPTQPAWVAQAAAGRSPSEWIGAWADEA